MVIGKSYPDTGAEQGRAVLAALARHPATAKHVRHQARRAISSPMSRRPRWWSGWPSAFLRRKAT